MNKVIDELFFGYAIKLPDGGYYTGRVNSAAEPNAWSGKKAEAFTYTERGAYNKIDRCPAFAGCSVERVL